MRSRPGIRISPTRDSEGCAHYRLAAPAAMCVFGRLEFAFLKAVFLPSRDRRGCLVGITAFASVCSHGRDGVVISGCGENSPIGVTGRNDKRRVDSRVRAARDGGSVHVKSSNLCCCVAPRKSHRMSHASPGERHSESSVRSVARYR